MAILVHLQLKSQMDKKLAIPFDNDKAFPLVSSIIQEEARASSLEATSANRAAQLSDGWARGYCTMTKRDCLSPQMRAE